MIKLATPFLLLGVLVVSFFMTTAVFDYIEWKMDIYGPYINESQFLD